MARTLVLMSLILSMLSTGIAQQPQALLKLGRVTPAGGNAQHRVCLAVFADGSYELYRELTDWPHGIVKHEPYSGKLDSAEMEQLSSLLADPNLVTLASGYTKGGWIATPSEGQFDTLFVRISRPSGTQSLLFLSAAGHGSPAEVRGVYSTPQIKPLLSWYKQMTKRKSNPDPGITLDCSKR